MAPSDNIFAVTHYEIKVKLEELMVDFEDDAEEIEEIIESDMSLNDGDEVQESNISILEEEERDEFVEFLLCEESLSDDEETDETPRSSLQTCSRRLVFARRRLFQTDEESDYEED